LPSEIGLMSSLTYLGLQNNCLRGTIPSSYGSLSNLRVLHLDNQAHGYYSPNNWGLTGSIPGTFSLLTQLTNLNIGYNCLTGSIPSFIGTFTGLTELDVDVNYLTGIVPSSICKINANTLRSFQFSINNLCCYASCFTSTPSYWARSATPYNLTHDQRKQRIINFGRYDSSPSFDFRVMPECSGNMCGPTVSPTSRPTTTPTSLPSVSPSRVPSGQPSVSPYIDNQSMLSIYSLQHTKLTFICY